MFITKLIVIDLCYIYIILVLCMLTIMKIPVFHIHASSTVIKKSKTMISIILSLRGFLGKYKTVMCKYDLFHRP